MLDGQARPRLRGRRTECAALDRLVAAVRAGQSRALVLSGEAGIGKTTLLEYLSERASGCRVARAAGVGTEMELAFAGLHQMCAPMLDHLDGLPGPQRDALASAFGLRAGAAPDQFLVGLAVLSLLSDVAEEQPLVCLVDDFQYLDHASAQTLAFVARRLLAESVALVFAARQPFAESTTQSGAGCQWLQGLPELPVRALNDADARSLLDSVLRGPVDARVRDRIVAEARGNPLALRELPSGLTPEQLAGGFGWPVAGWCPGGAADKSLEDLFVRRLESLPVYSRRFVLTAALEPVGDATLLWDAAARLGVPVDAAAVAEAAGLIEIGARVTLRHCLVRTAACRAASAHELREVHRALADVTDPKLDPDRRAWHRANAAVGPDEDIAADLEHSAGRAQARGGLAAAGAFLERATELTPDRARRGSRALEAAKAKLRAGAPDAAEALLAVAASAPLDALQRARIALLRAGVAFARRRGSDAAPLLLEAARDLEQLDPGLARQTYLEALEAAVFAGRLSGRVDVAQVAAVARAAPPGPKPPGPMDLLLDGLTIRFTEGSSAAVAAMKRAVQALAGAQRHTAENLRWLCLGSPAAHEVWDDEAWYQLTTEAVAVARQAGALTLLPVALCYRAVMHVHAGEFGPAAALVDEADAINDGAGTAPPLPVSLFVLAWQGKEDGVSEAIDVAIEDAVARGEGSTISVAEHAKAVLYNGLGHYQDALVTAQRACEHDDLGLLGWSLTELVEAGARSGSVASAAAALRRLEEHTRPAGTDWALGILARSSALLRHGEEADALYQEALERLGRTRIAVHVARAHLVYGEWLRREGRRVDAREHLRAAHEMFIGMGADAFAERTRRELLATGEAVRKRSVATRDDLTAQEAQIARLAADGRTNQEIGAELFISPRTVEWHLRKVFMKFGIRSRKELRAALSQAEPTAAAA